METIVRFCQQQFDEKVLGIPFDFSSYPLWRIFVGYMIVIYVSAIALYFCFSGLDFYYVFVRNKKANFPKGDEVPAGQNWKDIKLSVISMFFEAIMVSFFYLGIDLGYSHMYYDVYADGKGWMTILYTTVGFLALADCAIYWIHRGLHHPSIYRFIHKPHHGSLHVTPWTSHAFHPVDGFLQGLPYYLFVYFLPMHHIQHVVLLLGVNMWTISIHDRITICERFGINGAGYHNVHHVQFNYNYGQYFTFWDKLCGTYKHEQVMYADLKKLASQKNTIIQSTSVNAKARKAE
eukprot:ANDGO_05405.mRNA.1 putative Delta(7)-sterol 5(6)-desaturase